MRAMHMVLFALALLEVGVLVLATRSTHVAWPAVRVAGTCLLLATVAWVMTARLQLGTAFSVTAQARKLVTSGLYARIRNPIYVASPFLLLSLAMVLGRWWPLLLTIVIVPMQVVRARREAAVLRAAFGEEYARYRARTWF